MPQTAPIAVLYQRTPPPVLGGVRKPMKDGGYSDSGADIAHALNRAGLPVLAPTPEPDPTVDLDWVYPDTEEGCRQALARGAGTLWLNTVLFHGHPLERFDLGRVRLVGQTPDVVHRGDDKWTTNSRLRAHGIPVPPAILVDEKAVGELLSRRDAEAGLAEQGLGFPLILKPVRGRGSQGVVRMLDLGELESRAAEFFAAPPKAGGDGSSRYGSTAILEKYLPGREVTVTVMPPGQYSLDGVERECGSPWSLPRVERVGHRHGVAPYSGVEAVTANSVLLEGTAAADPRLEELARHCERAAALVGATAPLRIDCRESADGEFMLFDVNMKPNMTGPGRPGRDDQHSLTLIAAGGIGWSYTDLLSNMLRQAYPGDRFAIGQGEGEE